MKFVICKKNNLGRQIGYKSPVVKKRRQYFLDFYTSYAIRQNLPSFRKLADLHETPEGPDNTLKSPSFKL